MHIYNLTYGQSILCFYMMGRGESDEVCGKLHPVPTAMLIVTISVRIHSVLNPIQDWGDAKRRHSTPSPLPAFPL